MVPWCASSPGCRLNKPGISGKKLSCKLCAGTAPVGANGHAGPRGPTGAHAEYVVWGFITQIHCHWAAPLLKADAASACCRVQGHRRSRVAAGGNLGEHRPQHALGWELSSERQHVPGQTPGAVRPCPKCFLYCY